MNSYDLSRTWFNFCFENPEKIKPNHSAVYFFAIEHCNRLGWKEKFGFPTTMVMEAIGIKSYNTYINTLHDLVNWKFIKMIEVSKNQYSANVIALLKFNKALDKALDKALIKHSTKQGESTVQSIDSIDKQETIEQENKITINNILLSKIKISDLTEKEKKYFDISVLFQKLFIKNLEEKNSPTKNQQNAKFGNYVTPIRLMIENDEVTHEQFRIVYDYLGSIEGEFWKPNILSTKKLREKFQTLILQSQKIHTNGQQERTKYTGKSEVRYSDDFKRKIADRLRA